MVVRVHVTRDIILYLTKRTAAYIRAPAMRSYICTYPYFMFALFSCDAEQAEKSAF